MAPATSLVSCRAAWLRGAARGSAPARLRLAHVAPPAAGTSASSTASASAPSSASRHRRAGHSLVALRGETWKAASSSGSGRAHRCFATSASSASSSSADGEAAPAAAHLSYDPRRVEDLGTLAMMARSAASEDYKDEGFWRACSLQAQRLMGSPGAEFSELSRFVEAAAMARVRDNELLYNFGDLAANAPQGLDPEALAAALHAHALLGFRNDRVLRKLEGSLMTLMRESRATAAGLALSIRSLAMLHSAGAAPAPAPELLDAVSRMVSEHIGFFTVHHLCEVAEAYGAYRIQGDRQTARLLGAIGGAVAKDAAALSASQCAAAAKAFAKCRVHDERLLSALGHRLRDRDVRGDLSSQELADTLYGLAKFTCQDTALLDLLSIEARRRLHDMDIPELSVSLASLAKAGVVSPVLTSRAAIKLRRCELSAFDATSIPELAALAMALGKLQARDERLFGVLGDAFLAKPGGAISRAQCGTLVNIIHAFTKVHATHGALFGEIGHSLAERFEELTVHELVKLLHAAAKVDLEMPEALLVQVGRALDTTALERLGVFELLKLATAARRLRINVPALEAHMGAVLPNEVRGLDALSPPRRPTPKKVKPKSVRKRKWTW
eukprot:TRINITY_DN5205_c7_g1_i1.p1 TRINITY_DN5205_c7_g1~~TRINITY_DN5205_c7_g1_i1.p1  ORF type:complete len:646 (-),score=154.35 TRINITY_DN5205_c7_g1_i1:450-2291(-)